MRPVVLKSPEQWLAFVAVGLLCIIAGGLVAAITSASPSEHGAWVAAYLVLVGGVAQVGLGLGQSWLASHQPSTRVLAAEFVALNLGNAAVITGELAGEVWLVDLGGVLLVLALALFLFTAREARGGFVLWGYRLLIAIVLVSIPVGLILARIASE